MLRHFSQTFFHVLVCLLMVYVVACKSESKNDTTEESIHMADYEKPGYRWGFIDTSGEVSIEATFDEVSTFSEGKSAVNVDGLWGFIDVDGTIIIEPRFKSAYSFHENRAKIKQFDSLECYIDTKGTLISSKEWEAADDFSNGRARVKVGSLHGFIDSLGSLVIKPVYSRAWNFQKGLAKVEFESKQGVIDLQGNYVVQPAYDKIVFDPDAKWILGLKQNTTYVLNALGKEMTTIRNAKALETDGRLVALSKQDGLWLYDFLEKRMINKLAFAQLFYLGDKLWAAKDTSAYIILNQSGAHVNDKVYDQINKYSDGFAAFRRAELWGYVNTRGEEVTEVVFGLAWDYKEGFARAAFEEGIAFINRQQKLAFLPPKGTTDLRDFHEGLAPFKSE